VPHRFVLLGIPLVIWHDQTSSSDGQGWRVFVDACPHRLVPLSEGRVTAAGRLECPYVSGGGTTAQLQPRLAACYADA
jgi:phenylpropionate dioxygenase-like ring-hydroxylating dioxygenase large terminal subunit